MIGNLSSTSGHALWPQASSYYTRKEDGPTLARGKLYEVGNFEHGRRSAVHAKSSFSTEYVCQ